MKPELDPICPCVKIMLEPTQADVLEGLVDGYAICVEAKIVFYCWFIGLEDLIRFFCGAELGFWDEDPRQKQ